MDFVTSCLFVLKKLTALDSVAWVLTYLTMVRLE